VSSAQSPATALPEGDCGIASAYPGDKGIERDPRVIFAEDFEKGPLSEISRRWGEASNKDGQVLALANEVPPGSLGGHSLRVTAVLGENTGGHLYTQLARAEDTVFARFYVRFAPDAEYIHHFVTLGGYWPATRWPQGGAGERPQGGDRVTVGIEPTGDYGRYSAPGIWNFYTYWHEMKPAPDGKYWGNSFAVPDAPVIPRGRWICVEFMLKHNTPGQPDGEQAFWIDGKLLGHWKGINWRKTEQLRANALTVESYITDRWTKKPMNVVFFDNVVIARRYIGPAGK
jgi:hypothetical protein